MYYRITEDKDGHRARLYAANGRLVWWTEGYSSYQKAVEAIALNRQYAASAPLR